MAHSSKTQLAVRSSYVNEQQDLTVAASMHGVSYGTARNWKARAKKEGDDWDTAQLKPQDMVDLMSKWADSMSKVSKFLGTSNNFDKIGFAMELLQLLSTFIRNDYPQHAHVFLEILEPFGREVSKTYG